MKAEDLWQKFAATQQVTHEKYEAYQFGGTSQQADELASLVQAGSKTATTSAYLLYGLANETLPKKGDYSIILNAQNEALCIIQNTKVYVTPFDQVTPQHAAKEGEGDRTLAYWRQVHEEFFKNELLSVGENFHEKILVVCEEFEVVYPSLF